MQLSALLTLGLALAVAAEADPARTLKTRTRTARTKTPKPTQPAPVEVCKAGTQTAGGQTFNVICNTRWLGPQRYINGLQNANTNAAPLTIAGCEAACAATPDCCGANFQPNIAAQGNHAACNLIVKPSTDVVCAPDEYFISTSTEFPSGGVVGIFDQSR